MPAGPEIREMFARIAERYDRANHLLSLGIDRWWRRAAVRELGGAARWTVLDVCAGTGDLSFALSRAGARVVGSDFCREMLARTRGKGFGLRRRPDFVAADALALPFADGAFDGATVAFGIRNVSDPVTALAEMARVVRPGGRVVVLEFTTPELPLLRHAYRSAARPVGDRRPRRGLSLPARLGDDLPRARPVPDVDEGGRPGIRDVPRVDSRHSSALPCRSRSMSRGRVQDRAGPATSNGPASRRWVCSPCCRCGCATRPCGCG
jgi:ubiquinone/menaquinone biosynthesis methyltransferase